MCNYYLYFLFGILQHLVSNAAAKLLQTVFGIQYQVGLLIGVVVIMAYTFMGGYFAVVWTDFFQGMLMFFALLIVPIVAYAFIKADFSSVVSEMPGYMNFLKESDGSTSTWQYVVSNLGWGLGYFGMPHILVRFMSIKSSSMIKKSRRIAIVWVIITLVASVAVGVLGYVYLFQTEGTVLQGAASETIFMVLVQRLTPGFIAGILLCAIVAAIMSFI